MKVPIRRHTTTRHASRLITPPMYSGDDTRHRVKSMIRNLKTILGPEAYDAFRRAARASQKNEGVLSPAIYYHYAKDVLSDYPDVLDEVIGTYPDEGIRKKLEVLRAGDLRTELATSPLGAPAGTSQSYHAECLGDGLVVLRDALDHDAQAWLVKAAFEAGDANGDTGTRGFYEKVTAIRETLKSEGAMVGENGDGDDATATTLRLNQGTRGRVILGVDKFPDRLRELCMQCVELAQTATDTMPSMNPTTTLVNFYKENAVFKWHRDSEDPNVQHTPEAPPIVSFTVGLSCDFAVKHSIEGEEHTNIRLNSGDVILFGGYSRMLVHSVLRVIPKTMPSSLRGKMLHGRLNVTVRDIGNGVIDESQFPAYRVYYNGELADGQV